MPAAGERFTAPAAAAVRAAIADAGGNEVFLLGSLDSGGAIDDVRVIARGNRHAVPAILHIPRPGEVVIHNHPSGAVAPSDADLGVAAAFGDAGVGFVIVDNAVELAYVVVEPHRESQPAPIDIGAAQALLAPGGAVARALGAYEHRAEQLDMLAAVAAAFNDDGVLTVEAGTGTGKSFAYLIPAILWSRANRERVIVSTHTINLQEQLLAADLPMLVERSGLDCAVALIKGRRNYACQRKLAQVAAQGEQLLDDGLQAELRELAAWARTTADGSLADLPVAPRPEVWEQVASENDNCLRVRCPFYATCFFYTARRAAAQADLLIVNHHLLMADLALRAEIGSYVQNAVLPPATRVIVDEAHHLEEAATAFFGSAVSLAAVERPLHRLQHARNPARGVLPALLLALESVEPGEDRPLADGAVRWIDERLLPGVQRLTEEARECFAAGAETLAQLLERPLPRAAEKIRVVGALRQTPFWQQTTRGLSRLAAALDTYATDLGGVTERLEHLRQGGDRQLLFLGAELRAVRARIAACAAGLLLFLEEDDEQCRWVEAAAIARTGPRISVHVAPVAVGPLLRPALFERCATVVLTSATLAVGARFDYLHQRLGLDDLSIPERLATQLIASPFDYRRQAVIGVPDDLPEPTEPDFGTAAHDVVAALVRAAAGGTFVLFTSYTALERAWEALEPGLRADGYVPLRQGAGSRHRLLREFVRASPAVLFATDSFWEGVDVRGDALRCVIIARLPFSVPTEPLQQARLEAIEARGGSPFLEHTVPQAVLKLKQGFGRLIRSRGDRGAVVLLDSRAVRRRYGHHFLDALPPAGRVIGSAEDVVRTVQAFFGASAPRRR